MYTMGVYLDYVGINCISILNQGDNLQYRLYRLIIIRHDIIYCEIIFSLHDEICHICCYLLRIILKIYFDVISLRVQMETRLCFYVIFSDCVLKIKFCINVHTQPYIRLHIKVFYFDQICFFATNIYFYFCKIDV